MKYPKVVIGVTGSLTHLSPSDAAMVATALANAAKMLNEADHEKIGRQYREGVISDAPGFRWFESEDRNAQ
jgi:hypothetical protein